MSLSGNLIETTNEALLLLLLEDSFQTRTDDKLLREVIGERAGMTVYNKRFFIKQDGVRAFCEYVTKNLHAIKEEPNFCSYNSHPVLILMLCSQQGHPTMLFPHTTGEHTCHCPLVKPLKSIYLLCSR